MTTNHEPFHDRVRMLLAHLWMVRTFLKHAPEFAEDHERMQIPRTIFDFVRAVEARMDNRPDDLYKMLCKKLPRLRAVAEQLSAELDAISNHTNFQMAALALEGASRALSDVAAEYAAGKKATAPPLPGPPEVETVAQATQACDGSSAQPGSEAEKVLGPGL